MSVIDEIKALKVKREQAQTLRTKYTTQLESLINEEQELVRELAEKYNVTPETAKEKLAAMVEKRDVLLAEAKSILSEISTIN